MENDDRPQRLFHGTPHEIHNSERPYLAPNAGGGYDEGDPQEAHVFATPDLLMASLFSFKDTDCINITRTGSELVIVYGDRPPQPDAKGYVFEVAPEGFEQTEAHGRPTGKWAKVASEMPRVADSEGGETPGIPLDEPVREVRIRDLIEQEHLKICTLTGVVDADTYADALREATRLGAVDTFLQEAFQRGWLRDITGTYADTQHGE